MTGSALHTTPLAYLPARLPPDARLYLRPAGLLNGRAAAEACERGAARRLAAGRQAFTACEVLIRDRDRLSASVAALSELETWGEGLDEATAGRVSALLERLTAPRSGFAGGDWERPALMGVVNVTPDSFSDAGETVATAAAIERARALAAAGAAIVDVGGESTRPGARPVAPEAEIRRVLPVLEGLAGEGLDGALLSIDTRHAAVMRAALAAGVGMINDVSALTDDPESLGVAATSDARVVLMHKPGAPAGTGGERRCEAPALDVFDALEARAEACVAAGIARDRLIVDPGIAFGKGGAENLAILQRLALLHGLGCPILLGVSRKGLTGEMERRWPPKARLPGSLAAAVYALGQGVQLLRVHDVAESRQAISVWERISG